MFWIKLGVIIVIASVIISMVQFILRKVFKIEKVKKGFISYNYINDLHRKIDKWIRNISSVTLGVLVFIQLKYFEENIYLFACGIILFLVLDYSVRLFFEWKYSAHPKQAILTITEMFLGTIAVIIVLQL
ncbi:DUF4181 domain-containing protein [Rossellomorea vietnamensis]|uniref:DUF4181 domain-containing protein n=1 Tax=Rossellomorea vietnamensis TaxID=218284 RepID=A0A5D4NTD7_9BACI|nr:DUF4181 domain-containing protein [Rossellomorea vietnamensis]TYS17139.1 DUF4181 domain-containing protein [Rossellomorea vietnamensis]